MLTVTHIICLKEATDILALAMTLQAGFRILGLHQPSLQSSESTVGAQMLSIFIWRLYLYRELRTKILASIPAPTVGLEKSEQAAGLSGPLTSTLKPNYLVTSLVS